ncbi:AAEL001042-PA [Aedes aegypti]|uniref:AAEL001042-PA n=1 Tax=Aedes aegypti TaxID=7159 RepID=Q17MH4_AEDAE|nr:AAEL001042-PA [Aedes aegypti]
MERRNSLTVLILMLAALRVVHPQAVGTDCNGKTFICLDDLRYQVCWESSSGQTATTDLGVFECDSNQYCSNEDQSACSSTTTTTTQASTTTFSTTTTEESSTVTSTQSTTTDPTSTDPTTDSTSTTSSTTESSFYCRKTGRFPHDSDCHKYYLCIVLPFGNYETAETCLFGWVFDPVSQRCTADQSKCQLQPQSFTCTSVGRFPDPSDSTRYFWCRWNASSSRYELMKMTCSFGFPFDANRGRCSGLLGFIGL